MRKMKIVSEHFILSVTLSNELNFCYIKTCAKQAPLVFEITVSGGISASILGQKR